MATATTERPKRTVRVPRHRATTTGNQTATVVDIEEKHTARAVSAKKAPAKAAATKTTTVKKAPAAKATPVKKTVAPKAPAAKTTKRVGQSTLPPEDGRVARGLATRLKIAKAARKIIEKKKDIPIIQEVADASGVALRTVYHHFEDAETVIKEAFGLEPALTLVVTWTKSGKKTVLSN